MLHAEKGKACVQHLKLGDLESGMYPGEGGAQGAQAPPRARVCLMNIVCTYHNLVY